MIPIPLLLFWKKWSWALPWALLALAVIAALWYRGESLSAEAKLGVKKTELANCSQKISDQNEAIKGWEAEANAQKQRAEKALKEVEVKTKARVERVIEYRNAIATPTKPESVCPAADGVAEIRSIIRGRQQ